MISRHKLSWFSLVRLGCGRQDKFAEVVFELAINGLVLLPHHAVFTFTNLGYIECFAFEPAGQKLLVKAVVVSFVGLFELDSRLTSCISILFHAL